MAAVGDGAELLDVGAEHAVGERVDHHGATNRCVLNSHAFLSAAGDRQQQGDLLAVGQGLVAGHVLARDDREHRSQRGREVRFVLREPGEEVADGGALSELDRLQRRGRKAREPGAETDPDRQSAASLTASRE